VTEERYKKKVLYKFCSLSQEISKQGEAHSLDKQECGVLETVA
jgi:hypothetical protein